MSIDVADVGFILVGGISGWTHSDIERGELLAKEALTVQGHWLD